MPVAIFSRNLIGLSTAIFLWALMPADAYAFDCSKAASPTELTICGNPQLLEIDENMELIYFSFARQLDTNAKNTLRDGQRNWLRRREVQCEGELSCLIEEDELRLNALEAALTSSPQMIPIFKWQPGGQNSYRVRFEAAKFVPATSRAQRLFNREIEKELAQAPFGEITEEQSIGPWEYDQQVDITQLTDYLLSATAFNYSYAGGAHPNTFITSININMQTGEKLTVKEVFGSEGLAILQSLCRNMVIDAKTENSGQDRDKEAQYLDEQYGDEIRKHVADMAGWSFDKTGATILFNAYQIGSYAEGTFACEFSHDELARMAIRPEIIAR